PPGAVSPPGADDYPGRVTVLTRLGRQHDRPAAVGTRLTPLVAGAPRLPGWIGPVAVALIAFGIRLWRLGEPHKVLFDETYYAKDAYALLQFGYVQDYKGEPEKVNEAILDGRLTDLFTGQPTQ